MRTTFKLAGMLVLGAGTLTAAAADQHPPTGHRQRPMVVEAPGLRVPGTVDRSQARLRQELLHARLMAEQVEAALAEPLIVTVPERDLEAIRSGRCEDCAASPFRQLVGVEESVGGVVDLAGLAGPVAKRAPRLPLGAIRQSDGVEYVWTLAIRSPGAAGLRVHFTDFTLPPGSELYLYTPDGDVFGPYSGGGPLGTGEFWSHTVSGDLALLQLHWSGVGMEESLLGTYFQIADVGVMGPWYQFVSRPASGVAAKAFCENMNEPCVENAECVNNSAVNDAKDAVAYILFRSGGWYYICTGGLLDNTGPDPIPYFLTANHCISKSREAASLEAYFQYTAPCGTTSCTSPPTDNRTLGATLLAGDKGGDFTLLELAQSPPGGSSFLGWTDAPVAFADGTGLYRISHPSGAPQAYSEHKVDVGAGTCTSWPRGSWIYSRDTYGATEGGSSGSPVLNASGEVVGQLSGACGYNVNDPCDSSSNATVDGAFAYYFDQVAPWLAPDATPCTTDADGDGYMAASCGGDDCNDGDAAINPGATEICDGIDNNCNGSIDENCGGECLPLGALCSVDTDCCSSKCRGKAGAKICR